MSSKSFSRNLLSLFIILAMVITTIVPVGAGATVSAAAAKDMKTILNTSISGDIGTAGSGKYVSGLVEDSNGDMIVLGTTDNSIFLNKYGKDDLDNAKASAEINGGKQDIDDPDSDYVFAAKDAKVYAGDNTYNGALATDAKGNVYVAVTEKATNNLLYSEYSELKDEFPDDCICDEFSHWYYECVDENGDPVDCPVCKAYDKFAENFQSGATKGITLYKFDNSLNKVGEFKIGEFASKNTGTIDDPLAHGLAVDNAGNIYVGGQSGLDLGFENSTLAFDYFDGAGRKGYIAKINPEMTEVTASTWLAGGGANSYDSAVNNIAIDGDILYALGKDFSGNIPNCENAKDSSNSTDGYIAKLSLNNLAVNASTYFGGSDTEEVSALKVKDGMVYVGGDTASTDFPVSDNARFKTKAGSTWYPDGFVLKIDSSLKKTDKYAASYYNGTSREDLFALDVDANGNIYFAGGTTSGSGIETTDGSSSGNAFVGKFNPDCSEILVSTVLGLGESRDQGRALLAADKAVYLAGQYGGSSTQPFIAKYGESFAHSKIKSIKAAQTGTSSKPLYYSKDTAIDVNVTFDTKVNVTGTPQLELNIENAGTQQKAVYKEGTGTKVLTFSYTVKDGDTTKGDPLNISGDKALDLNGGTILPAAGGTEEDIDLSIPADSSSWWIYVSTTPANADKVTSDAEDATYGSGATIPISVTFSDKIKEVAGTPELEMNSGGKALYKGINTADKKTLEFEYVVGKDDAAEKLEADKLVLPEGATIKDNFGMEVNPALPAGSLGQEKSIVINPNTVVVKDISIDRDYKNKAYNAGKAIPITVTFSEAVTTDKNMELKLNASKDYGTAKAIADPVKNINVVTFNYTVAKDDSAEVLDYTSVNSLALEADGAITSGSNPVSLYLPEPGSEQSLSKDKVVIDNAAPANNYSLSLTSNQPKAKYYKADDVMELKVPMGEEVFVKDGAKPYIEMAYKTDENAEANNRWTFDRAEVVSGKSNLYFTYKVTDADNLKNGNLYDSSNWKIYAAEGEVTDAAGNDLEPALKTLSTWPNPLSGIYFDSAAPVWEEGAELKVENVEGEKNIKITRPNAADDVSGLMSGYSSSQYPYILYRQEKDGKDEPVQVTTMSSSGTSYTDTGVAEDTTYIYTLAARDNCSNISEKLTAEITTTNNAGQVDDTDAPYWDDDAALNIERTTESTAIASWDKTKAHDAISELKEFRVYVKKGLLSGWDLVATAPADQETAEITGLELDEKYAFKVEVVDAGRNELESTTGPQVELDEEFPAMVVQDQNGKVLKQFISNEFSEEDASKIRFSSLNNHGTRSYYAVTGIEAAELIERAGVKYYTHANFTSGDAASAKAFTKAQLEEGTGYYYYPPKYDGVNVKAENVKPMIAFWYGEDEGAEPDFIVGGEPWRLFFGQTSINDVNKSSFVKNVYEITVFTTEKTVGIEDSDNYKEDTAAELPTVVATKDGEATVTATIDQSKIDADAVMVNIIQMRGDKMVAISSAKDNAAENFEVSGTFDLKEGDKVQFILTDKLDGTKGSGAEIINNGPDADTPKIGLKDVYLKDTDTAVIKGTAKASTWVSAKITDKDNRIVYFNGEIADDNGNFAINADLEGIDRPLDVTITSGKSVKTAVIYNFKKLERIDTGSTELTYVYGDTAKSIDSGITGTKVKYQWYSNTKKSNTGGSAITSATNKTYTPSTSKAGTKYYYAIATDMDGNTLKTPAYTVKVNPVSISEAKATLNTLYWRYTGSQRKPVPKVVLGSKTLVNGTDYTLSYGTNKYPGYGYIYITGKGNYTGKVTKTFYISRVSGVKSTAYGTDSIKLTWAKQSNVTGYKIYKYTSDGYKRVGVVKGSSNNVYTVKNLYSGRGYSFKVRAYKKVGDKIYNGLYSNYISAPTRPTKATMTKLTTGSSHYVKAYWKQKRCTGYQVKIARNSKFTSYDKVYNVKSYKQTSLKMLNRTKGKTYYVKVRAYKTYGGKTVYGSWSTYKKITCK